MASIDSLHRFLMFQLSYRQQYRQSMNETIVSNKLARREPDPTIDFQPITSYCWLKLP